MHIYGNGKRVKLPFKGLQQAMGLEVPTSRRKRDRGGEALSIDPIFNAQPMKRTRFYDGNLSNFLATPPGTPIFNLESREITEISFSSYGEKILSFMKSCLLAEESKRRRNTFPGKDFLQLFDEINRESGSIKVTIKILEARFKLTADESRSLMKNYIAQKLAHLHSEKEQGKPSLSDLANAAHPMSSLYLPKGPRYDLNEMKAIFNHIAKLSGNEKEFKHYFSSLFIKGDERKRFFCMTGYDLLQLSSNELNLFFRNIFNKAYFNLMEELKRLDPNKVTKLDLSERGLKILPMQLFKFENLEELILDKNELIAIPEHIAFLKNLEFLSLRENKICYFPKGMANLPKIKAFLFDRNLISYEVFEPLIQSFYEKKYFTYFSCSENFFSVDDIKNKMLSIPKSCSENARKLSISAPKFIYDAKYKFFCRAYAALDPRFFPEGSVERKFLEQAPKSPILRKNTYNSLRGLKKIGLLNL